MKFIKYFLILLVILNFGIVAVYADDDEISSKEDFGSREIVKKLHEETFDRMAEAMCDSLIPFFFDGFIDVFPCLCAPYCGKYANTLAQNMACSSGVAMCMINIKNDLLEDKKKIINNMKNNK